MEFDALGEELRKDKLVFSCRCGAGWSTERMFIKGRGPMGAFIEAENLDVKRCKCPRCGTSAAAPFFTADLDCDGEMMDGEAIERGPADFRRGDLVSMRARKEELRRLARIYRCSIPPNAPAKSRALLLEYAREISEGLELFDDGPGNVSVSMADLLESVGNEELSYTIQQELMDYAIGELRAERAREWIGELSGEIEDSDNNLITSVSKLVFSLAYKEGEKANRFTLRYIELLRETMALVYGPNHGLPISEEYDAPKMRGELARIGQALDAVRVCMGEFRPFAQNAWTAPEKSMAALWRELQDLGLPRWGDL